MERKENVYICDTCRKPTVTVDIHEGATPFLLGCRASGDVGDCPGMAVSEMYPHPLIIAETYGPPEWEWFRPEGQELARLDENMRYHVMLGGLDLRKRE